jgi:iron(III) transport system ATP-binding protein
MLKVNAISVAYDQHTVVRDVSFSLERGRLGAIVGPSGSGKSTLLRALAGFEPVRNGTIELAGHVVATEKSFVPPEKRPIGFVFQDFALFPHLTVAQNIGFGLRKWSAAKRLARVHELLELTDLAAFRQRYPQQLSGGQQQRVALARALAPEPQLLLLDEPFASLDLALRERMKKELGLLLRRVGVTSLLVTHNLDEAFDLADEMGVMLDGALLQWGEPRALYDAPQDRGVATYLGTVSFLPVVACDGQSCHTELGKVPFALDRCGTGKTVAVRPENLLLKSTGELNGKITDVWFRGAFYLYNVALSSGHQVLASLPKAAPEQFQRGDVVNVGVVGACRIALD